MKRWCLGIALSLWGLPLAALANEGDAPPPGPSSEGAGVRLADAIKDAMEGARAQEAGEPGVSVAAPTHPSAEPMTAAQLYAAVSNSVVVIRTDDSLGAGFLVRNRRLVATAFHVIEDGGPVSILSRDGETYQAEVYAYDREHDLAVLELDSDFAGAEPLTLRADSTPGVGEAVAMVGHPFGDYADTIEDLSGLLTWTITSGIVGAVSPRFIQTDAASSPGNSGGPILDMHGRVLGVVSRRLEDAEGLTFSVPVIELKRLLDNPGTPEPLKRQPRRRFGVGVSRYSTTEDLWMDGIFLVFDRAPRAGVSRYGVRVGYNTVNEVPEESGLFHYSEDDYWLQFEGGARLKAPIDIGSLDPFIGLRVGWHRQEVLTLSASTVVTGCDSSSEQCELSVTFDDSGDNGFRAFAVGGISWNGDIGMIGIGGMLDPFARDERTVRWGGWASVWF